MSEAVTAVSRAAVQIGRATLGGCRRPRSDRHRARRNTEATRWHTASAPDAIHRRAVVTHLVGIARTVLSSFSEPTVQVA